MFLQDCLIRMFGWSYVVQFGNRSWIGLPFNETNDSFPVHEEHNDKPQDKENVKPEIAFNFSNNKLSVV